MNVRRSLVIGFAGCLAVCLASHPSEAADWPQWRGAGRNGVAADSPALLDAFPEGGLKKLWESEELYKGGSGGWGSVAVADGRAYVFADWSYNVPKEDRVIEKGTIGGHGWAPDMPAELSKKVEEARVSDARKNLKDGKQIDAWVNEWLKANVSEENKKFRGAAQVRVRAGDKAVALDVLAKMAGVVDKPFANQQALDAWFRENGIDEATQQVAAKWVAKTRPESRDFLVCLEAATGKTLWKTEVKSKGGATYNDSGTPAVAEGRAYVLTAASHVSCLDAKTGAVLWEKQPFTKPADAHSSVLVVDGVAVASGGSTVGLDARTGETLWEAKDLPAGNPSPGLWKSGNLTCVVINSRKLACLDVKTGKVLWEQRGGGSASPTVVGDHLVLIIGQKLTAFQLSPEKAEKLWEMPFADDYASVLISGEYVYAVGAAPRGGKEGRAVCVELKTGKPAWDSVVPGGPTCSSPLLADGKIVAFTGGLLTLIRATPEKYTQLGQSPVGGEGYTSPALCDGKLFVRVNNKVTCYDLKKP